MFQERDILFVTVKKSSFHNRKKNVLQENGQKKKKSNKIRLFTCIL